MAFQCGTCPDDIAIGSPAAQNKCGVFCHPECVSLTPLEATRRAALRHRGQVPASAARRSPDLGDQVAARMAADARGYVAGRSYEELVQEELLRLLSDDDGVQLTPQTTTRHVGAPSAARDLGEMVADLICGVQS